MLANFTAAEFFNGIDPNRASTSPSRLDLWDPTFYGPGGSCVRARTVWLPVEICGLDQAAQRELGLSVESVEVFSDWSISSIDR